MAGSIRVGSIADIAALESACNSFSDGLRDQINRFIAATSALECSWRDAEYKKIEELAAQIASVCNDAQSVVSGILIPFVARKRAVLENRPA